MSDRGARTLAAFAAFLLPLGTIGIAGIVCVGLYLVTFGRRASPGEARLVLAATPLALALPASTLLYGQQVGTSPSADAWVHAIGMAAILLLGPLTLRRMAARAGAGLLAAAFVVGALALAASVIADAATGWHAIPAGLFLRGDLHNVAAAVLVLAFPLALHFAEHGRARLAGGVAALVLAATVLVAWSWVGALGLAAAALAFMTFRRGWESAVVIVPGALALAAVGWWSVTFGAWSVPGLDVLGEVLSSRARIFAQGLELAAQRPWAGWGSHLGDLAGPLGGVGRYHVDDLVLPHFHSLYVQTLFETGVPGLMALAFWFGYLLVAARGPWRAPVAAALIGFLVTQAFDLAWPRSMVAVAVALVAVLALAPRTAAGATFPSEAPAGASPEAPS